MHKMDCSCFGDFSGVRTVEASESCFPDHTWSEDGARHPDGTSERMSVNDTGEDARKPGMKPGEGQVEKPAAVEEDAEEDTTTKKSPTEKPEFQSSSPPSPEEEEEEERSHCQSSSICFSDSDCYGGTCFGLGINKCACLSCATGSICSETFGCGGLKGACNLATSRCNCERAFMNHGYKSLGDAMNDLCNVRYCVPNTDSCLGMPCNPGNCICNSKD